MTRESLINNGHAIEVQRLVRELPNDMELGKAIRKIITDSENELKRVSEEDAKDPNTK
jgi:hypothetical protein